MIIGLSDWIEIRVTCKVSIMHDWKSYARRLSIIEEESATPIASNQHGFIFIISQAVEGYLHAVVLVDNQPGYRWIYGIKTKDETIKVVKQWYSDIADLLARHKLVVDMRDNAGENKSQKIQEFFESLGVRNHFSTPKEQWQNGAAKSTINSIILISRTVMAES
jgi:hypothetical protein